MAGTIALLIHETSLSVRVLCSFEQVMASAAPCDRLQRGKSLVSVYCAGLVLPGLLERPDGGSRSWIMASACSSQGSAPGSAEYWRNRPASVASASAARCSGGMGGELWWRA